MKITHIGRICIGQDGAIWGDYLFRLDGDGRTAVYNLKKYDKADPDFNLEKVCEFYLDRANEIMPHSNSVMYGTQYYDEKVEFPLLYSNIYNNYRTAQDPMLGTCCVYRLQRDGNKFTSTLVQIIRVGFAEDEFWRSSINDIRPFGNFAIDRDTGKYYGFVMREGTHNTRYFEFDLPKYSDGEIDEKTGVKTVVLTKEDVKKQFDCEFHRYIQGACCKYGRIFSTEGFNGYPDPPALRIINVKTGEQEAYFDLVKYDMHIEPELIDFMGDTCYYADAFGDLCIIDFETKWN